MTKYHSSDIGVSPEANEFEPEDAESDISGLLKGSPSFQNAGFFNGKKLEKMRPKKVAKFRFSRGQESDY